VNLRLKDESRVIQRQLTSAVMSSSASERTPLLRSDSANHRDDSHLITDNAITTAEVAEQGEGAAPQFPASDTRKNSLRAPSLKPNDDGPDIAHEAESLVKFQKDGKLEGVGVWKFRLVFGGILLGYFVSSGKVSKYQY
jgi:hypothetical protein